MCYWVKSCRGNSLKSPALVSRESRSFSLRAWAFEIIKAARLGAGTIVDHMLSTATFIVALVEFLLVPFCGTAAFFFLMIMSLIDVVAGYTVSILTARRDLSVNHTDGIGL